jgi:glycosyltransferase involved in cell wall biosynthesis
MGVYNGEKYLNKTMDSILNQNFSDFEFIIINDGSTDNTNDILKSYIDPRIRIFDQENRGLNLSLNRGISLASGEYIARQDADDISLPDRLKEQVEFMEKYENIVLVGSFSILINDREEIIGIGEVPRSDTEIRWKMIFNNPFIHTSTMMRSEILKKYNLSYNENDVFAQDFGLWSKIIKYGNGYNINKPLVKKRMHENQVSIVFSEKQENIALQISKKNMERLGIKVTTLDEVRKIRNWEDKFPLHAEIEDIHVCRLFIKLLKNFKNSERVDKIVFKNIFKKYYYHICNSINLKNIKYIYKSGLFEDIIKDNKYYVLKNFCLRSIKNIIRK